jgi:hypothetical protein
MANILKEPLVHFLCIGVLIFLLYSVVAPKDLVSGAGNEIVVSVEDVDRLSQDWSRKWNRLPSPEELEALVEARIREEVYCREALAMGLDRDDTVVRRRLMQKMEFLSNDLAAQDNPDDVTLRDYFLANADVYRQPAQVSFQHIYFSRDRRGNKVQQDAEALLAALNSKPDTALDSQALGDPFMHPAHFEQQSPAKVARVFGGDFATQLFKAEAGSWQGPFVSGYGLHLLRIEEKSAAQLPELVTVIDDVRRDWMFAQRKQANELIYQRLKSRYQIRVDQGGSLSNAVATAAERNAS